VAYAGALAAACPWLGIRPNLLPRPYRSSGSRVLVVPALVLSLLLLVLAGAVAAQPELARRRQLALLEAEIAKLEPQALRVEALRKKIQKEQEQILLLDAFRNRTREDLDALNALTKALAPPAWLNTLELNRESALLSGEIDQAAPLLKLLDETPYFRNSEFAGPVGRSGTKETFRIRTAREGVTP
jgi:Tfp pilus assembly protein PilN